MTRPMTRGADDDAFDSFCRAMLDRPYVPPSIRVDARGGRRARVELGDFAGHVPYLPGDDLRFLDWKALARSGEKHLRTYEEQRHRRLALIVDRSASMLVRQRALSWLLRLWTWLALHRLDSLEVVSLQGDELRRELFQGPDAWPRIAEDLRELELGGTRGLDALHAADWGLRSDTSAVVVSDFADAAVTARFLEQARLRGLRLLLVFPRLAHEARLGYPMAGRVAFFDPESGETCEVDLGGDLHAAFLEEQRAWERRLGAAAAEYGHALLVADLPTTLDEALRVETWLPMLERERRVG